MEHLASGLTLPSLSFVVPDGGKVLPVVAPDPGAGPAAGWAGAQALTPNSMAGLDYTYPAPIIMRQGEGSSEFDL